MSRGLLFELLFVKAWVMSTTSRLILASASPRRQTLLHQMGLRFSVVPASIEEHIRELEPNQLATTLAEEKVEQIRSSSPEYRETWIVGADTIIVLQGTIIGKPVSREEGGRLLEAFSGATHQVITGVALYCPEKKTVSSRSAVTDVTFAQLSNAEIQWYLDTEEWEDVAGGYRIQGRGACFINHINGSFSNVMGLPIHTFYGMLRDNHYPLL
jgi:septum formation protein